ASAHGRAPAALAFSPVVKTSTHSGGPGSQSSRNSFPVKLHATAPISEDLPHPLGPWNRCERPAKSYSHTYPAGARPRKEQARSRPKRQNIPALASADDDDAFAAVGKAVTAASSFSTCLTRSAPRSSDECFVARTWRRR